MAITSAIRADLRRILLSATGLPTGLQYKWQGRKFTPTIGTPYLSERLDPVGSDFATLGETGSQQETAIYALDLYMPESASITEGEDAADAIRQLFWPGRQVGSAAPVPMWGNVQRGEVRAALESDGWTMHPVRIFFFVRRPTRMV